MTSTEMQPVAEAVLQLAKRQGYVTARDIRAELRTTTDESQIASQQASLSRIRQMTLPFPSTLGESSIYFKDLTSLNRGK